VDFQRHSGTPSMSSLTPLISAALLLFFGFLVPQLHDSTLIQKGRFQSTGGEEERQLC